MAAFHDVGWLSRPPCEPLQRLSRVVFVEERKCPLERESVGVYLHAVSFRASNFTDLREGFYDPYVSIRLITGRPLKGVLGGNNPLGSVNDATRYIARCYAPPSMSCANKCVEGVAQPLPHHPAFFSFLAVSSSSALLLLLLLLLLRSS